MAQPTWRAAVGLLVLALGASARGATDDDFIFIHYSCGSNWLNNGGLHLALIAKDYINESNEITYGSDPLPDPGRPDSLAPTPGNLTDMNHWVPWFNDYLGQVKTWYCHNGVNRIIMFKSCYPASNIGSDGTEPGYPFSISKTTVNYKAVFRHPDGPGHTYSHTNGYTYRPLEDVFADNPDTLFIFCTAPPLCWTASSDDNAHRAREFNNWAKGEWLDSYNAAHPGLNNVAVFDWFDFLAYPDGHHDHPNRLKEEYGVNSGNSHPNTLANQESTAAFATDTNNFIDPVWLLFSSQTSPVITDVTPDHGLPETVVTLSGQNFGDTAGTVVFTPDGGADADWGYVTWSDSEVTVRVPVGAPFAAGQLRLVRLDSAESNPMAFRVSDVHDLRGAALAVTPDNLWEGAGAAEVAFSVENAGPQAVGAFVVRFYLSDDSDIDPATDTPAALLGGGTDCTVPAGLASGATHADAVTIVVPTAMPWSDGQGWVGMVVDAADAIPEADEDNNRNRGDGIDRQAVTHSILREPDSPPFPTHGLRYAYYNDGGPLSSVEELDALTPAATGIHTRFDIDLFADDDDFGYVYTGYVSVATEGTHTFYTSSDDGSRLYIGDTLVVDNDGDHSETERPGVIGLKPGYHALTVKFYEDTGSQALTVSYEGPGLSKQAIPDAALYYDSAPPVIDSLTGDTEGTAGDEFHFQAAAHDDDGHPLTYTWSFGDGTPAQAGLGLTAVAHTYAQHDTYTLTLTVDDGTGATDVETLPVAVAAAVQPPGELSIATQVWDGTSLHPDAPAPRSLALLHLDDGGNPPGTLFALRVEPAAGAGWLKAAGSDLSPTGSAPAWLSAGKWAARLRGLAPATAYAFHATARLGVDESDEAPVGSATTNCACDADDSGRVTALDYALIKHAVLRGEFLWPCDVDDDGDLDAADLAVTAARVHSP